MKPGENNGGQLKAMSEVNSTNTVIPFFFVNQMFVGTNLTQSKQSRLWRQM